jgi:type II secretory pathway component PulJ
MNGRRRTARGLTLFEVIISIALIALLLGTLLTFFWQSVNIRGQVLRAADRTQIVQQTLQRMAAELQACVGVEKTGFPVQQFAGDRRSMTFLTAPLPGKDQFAFYRESEDRPPPQHDLREITYALWVDPEKTTEQGDPLVGGIIRTERRAIKPTISEGEVAEDQDLLYLRHDLWAPELGYLEFRYFDGVEWTTRWEVSEGNALPQLVQITVGFDSLTKDELEDRDLVKFPVAAYQYGPPDANPDRASLIVQIPAADQMFSSRLRRLANGTEEVYSFTAPGGATESGEPEAVPPGGAP